MIFAPVAAAAALIVAALPTSTRADVLIVVDKTSQKMRVMADGELAHEFTVSTGTSKYRTPVGSYGVSRMHRRWYSRKYDNAPMPHSIFFHRGYAIHGTTEISRLGRPASHGCVRLDPKDAATLFALVKEQGMDATKVTVTGDDPPPKRTFARTRSRKHARHRARARARFVAQRRARVVDADPFVDFFRAR